MSPTKKSDAEFVEEPSPSFLETLGKTANEKVGALLGIQPRPESERIHKLTAEQQEQLRKIEEEAIINFSGDLTQLEAALGMLRIGFHFGWKVLYILHSKQTIRKYEGILGVQVRELFPPEGPSSYRSYGFALANRFRNFWKVAGGEIKIPHRQTAMR